MHPDRLKGTRLMAPVTGAPETSVVHVVFRMTGATLRALLDS